MDDRIFDRINDLHRKLDERVLRAAADLQHDAFMRELDRVKTMTQRLSRVHLAACRRLYNPILREET